MADVLQYETNIEHKPGRYSFKSSIAAGDLGDKFLLPVPEAVQSDG